MNLPAVPSAYHYTVADTRPPIVRSGGRELDPFKKAVIETAATGKSLRFTGKHDDSDIKRLASRLGGPLRKRELTPRVARGSDGALYVWAEPRPKSTAAAPPGATSDAASPREAAAPGKYDTDVLDCLTLAGKKGSVKPSDIARRIFRDDKTASVEKLTQAVWGVLQRFVAAGKAVKLTDGGYRLTTTHAG